MRSDAEVFGECGGENYFLPLSNHMARRSLLLHGILDNPTKAQQECLETFLIVPGIFDLWFTQYETMEFLWIGEEAA